MTSFVPTAEIFRSCERRHIPRDILLLLAKLVDIHPESRPSAEKVKMGLRKLVSVGALTRLHVVEDQDTRAPFGSFSGIMTRFARPFEFMKASSEDVEEEVSPRQILLYGRSQLSRDLNCHLSARSSHCPARPLSSARRLFSRKARPRNGPLIRGTSKPLSLSSR